VNSLEIETALERARRTHGSFVFVPAAASTELLAALSALAAETGRELLHMQAESPTMEAARQAAVREVPTLARGDDAAFLENLSEIAAGRLKIS